MIKYLIACPLVFLAGFIDSIAGGGGLVSLPAYIFAGLPTHNAIATNKLSSAMGTSISTYHFIRQGYVRFKLVLPAIITALIGSWFGAHLSLYLDETVLKIVILAILPPIAFYVLKSKNLNKYEDNDIYSKKAVAYVALVSLVVGIYDGLYGPGTGTFLLLLFTSVCHLSLNRAAGTTKVVNLTTNIVSLTVFILNGKVLFLLGLTAGLCNMAGNYIGSHCFSKDGAKFVKPVILIVLIIFFIKTVYSLF